MIVLRLDAVLRSRDPAAAAAELVRLLSDPCSPPALVNNCAVKLADAFGHGDCLRRAVIAGCLRGACFRPSRVLNRTLVVERIGSVLAEDDPAARVLALQALRCVLPLLLDLLRRCAPALASASLAPPAPPALERLAASFAAIFFLIHVLSLWAATMATAVLAMSTLPNLK